VVTIVKGISDAEKYEFVGNLVDDHTQHELLRALFACSVPGGPVRLQPYGIQIEDHGRYYELSGGRKDMDITAAHVETVKVNVPEFLKLLTDMIDAGGMKDLWPGKIRIEFHIEGWSDIPVKPTDNRTIPGDTACSLLIS
jgi:hypothetical protein